MNSVANPPPITDLIEVNYHNLIGEEFIALRGFGFALSPVDLKLIDDWESRGVPSFIPLAVIGDVSDRVNLKGARRPRSLAYIKEEAEARFTELLEGHVGCGGCEKPYCSRRARGVTYNPDIHDRVCDTQPFCLCAIRLDPADERYAAHGCECSADALGLTCLDCDAVLKIFISETGEEVKAA